RGPPAVLRARPAHGPPLLPALHAGRRRARRRGPPVCRRRAHTHRRRGPRPLHPHLALAADGPGDSLPRAVPGARWEPHRATGTTGGSEPRCARLPASTGRPRTAEQVLTPRATR